MIFAFYSALLKGLLAQGESGRVRIAAQTMQPSAVGCAEACFDKLSTNGQKQNLCFDKLSTNGQKQNLCFDRLSTNGNN